MITELDRSKIPGPLKTRSFNFPEFERFTLQNGLEVIFAPHNKLPVLTFQLVLKSGANYDKKSQAGLASFTTELLAEGTKSRTSQEISNAFEHIGTQYNSHVDWNALYLEMVMLKKQEKASLDIFCDVLFNPAFHTEEIERLRKHNLNQRLRTGDSASGIANEIFPQTIFGNTRYALPISGRKVHMQKFKRDDFVDFYEKYFQPANATLVIVGDLSSDEARSLSEQYFERWPDQGFTELNEPQFEYAQKQRLFLAHKKDAQQAEIRIGHLGIDRNEPDYFAAILLNQILGGYFLSRINMNLREEKGYTYGASSRFFTRRTKGLFQISSAVETKYVPEAIQEIIKEIENIKNGPVSETELQQAQGYLNGIFPIAFESGTQIADGLSNIIVFDLQDDYYRTYRDKILAVTRDEILQAAKKYLHPQSLSIVVCTDKNEVKTRLREKFDVVLTEFKE